MPPRARWFWPVVITVLISDYLSKREAVASLSPPGVAHDVLGDVLRLTLTFNRGAALGLPAGAHGKEVLGVLAVVVSVILYVWYRRSGPGDGMLTFALSLIVGGALGNAWERLFSSRGVVDFIDVGIGRARFWTFNVADTATSVGAGLLILALWLEGRKDRAPPSEGEE